MDPRYDQLAKILVDYSTKTQKGDNVLIHMKEPESFPLVKAIYKQSILKGAFPEVYFSSTYLTRDRLKYGSEDQIKYIPKIDEASIDWADVWFGIRAVKNPYELKDIEAWKSAEDDKVYGRLATKRVEKCRWNLCWVPTEAFAQKAKMSMDDTVDFFFSAVLRDWSEEAKNYEEIRKVVQAGKEFRVIGKDTDLTFSNEGRKFTLSDGTKNMPGGEVFTAPLETSVEGKIYFDIPSSRGGQIIKDIYLEFSKGKVVKSQAKEGQEFLEKALEIDEGAKYVGEFAIGTNYGITRGVLDTLFDEKIGGTMHMALGQAYKECNGVNKSDLHWDMIKDLREEGEIYLDGKKIFKKGEFLF